MRLNFGDATLLFQPYYGTSQGATSLVPQEVIGGTPALACTPALPPSDTNCSWGPSPTGTVQYADFSADRMVGVNMSLGTDVFTVRVGHLQTLVSAAAFRVSEDDVTFSSAGGTLDWRNLVLYGEYFQREISGAANAAFPNQKGFYTTVGYRVGKFLPHLTYAKLDDYPQTPNDAGTPLKQTSATLGVRYELGTGAALKLEAQQVKPEVNETTGAGTRGLLMGVPENNKAMIYGVAVDVVF